MSRARLRVAAAAAVESAIRSRRPGASLRGSWATGDFHLWRTANSLRSFSDIDVYDPCVPCHLDEVWQIDIAGFQLHLRASIHPRDYSALLSPPGHRLVALVNLALSRTTRAEHVYVHAKSRLVLAGSPSGFSYRTAATCHSQLGDLALQVKLGDRPPLTRYALLLDPLGQPLLDKTIDAAGPGPEALRRYLAKKFQQPVPELPAYFTEYLRSKLDQHSSTGLPVSSYG